MCVDFWCQSLQSGTCVMTGVRVIYYKLEKKLLQTRKKENNLAPLIPAHMIVSL